ncbi:MAG: aldehyde dehydrogenase family protein [Alphaproteobacteria bacterium]|nr:aldehyde dehydrogenase family protein [Rhizobiaceae bacterium]MBU3962008.1 aldehyde dehydrogenase family protein [Alphaproteobacteria bacterium]MBU4050366.1 aldehyde dehydrogenase family protein [Alphaproteobacteria bacterium]MBU4088136.1 aldehyde dehydrogenase family protein [Alphaproteobacteria bacterium]MBU4158459.1 aldehyde dehydrogenase family protein [Alphaproteobacteria bacterium]
MEKRKFYIDGCWVEPAAPAPFGVVNPATEETFASISLGSREDVDRAVQAARRAFAVYGEASVEQRLDYLDRIIRGFRANLQELARLMTLEMGSPITFSTERQATVALFHFEEAARVLASYAFEQRMGSGIIRREPIGVCGLITPWNWPLNQVASKVAPALAAGCTVVLKPSELAPLSSIMLAEIIDEAGLPPGVFNLVNGDGPTVGEAIASHPDIDMVSFTGSTAAGIRVAKLAADGVKRVAQELGGKSANLILDDADIAASVQAGVHACYTNAGQNCQSPTRMLIPRSRRDLAFEAAKKAVAQIRLGDPLDPQTTMGPLVSRAQFDKVQDLIQSGIDEGAVLVAGGPGRPAEINRGYYVRPTVFGDVTEDMRIAREEIFGPVLSIMNYETEEEAIAIANNTPFGLAGFVQSSDPERARRIANRIRAGRVYLNGAPFDRSLPFGGYKQSGNGREFGLFGFEEYLEVKAILGYPT